jgi:hypothetical protein
MPTKILEYVIPGTVFEVTFKSLVEGKLLTAADYRRHFPAWLLIIYALR